ncbi:gamma-glutamyl-gamma-aminobutyrate hydrolase family protein [bacterium]|nr:gamma-glutamyl-gamma-aminobutyrate hydrolase family protein [bacterium]
MYFPIIGVTIHGQNEKGAYHTSAFYVDSIRRAGGIPLLIAPGESRLDSLIDRIDAFVFTGGGDIEPGRYGGNHHVSMYGGDLVRDQSEFTLAQKIIDQQLPVLAICRGMQVFGVLLGGRLKEDIESNPVGNIKHRLPDFKPVRHVVTLNGSSNLRSILKSDKIMGASIHHQAIEVLPVGAVPVAFSDDGIIEAFEFEKIPNLIAVQWHPEITAESDPIQQRLFDQLISMAITTSEKRR